MDLAFEAYAADDADDLAPRSFARPVDRAAQADAPLPPTSSYTPRRNRGAIAAVVLAHGVALYALIHFDVIAIRRAVPQRLAVTMVEVPPPPPPHEAARVAPSPKIETPIVAPPPIVALQAPPPPVIVAPPPPAPVLAPPAAAAPVVAMGTPGPVAADIMADVLDAPAPRFPAESRRLRESGTVRLRVVVSIEGRVADLTIAKSSGFDRLDKAALEAVRRWRFRPRVVAGTAAEAVGFVPVTFNPPH